MFCLFKKLHINFCILCIIFIPDIAGNSEDDNIYEIVWAEKFPQNIGELIDRETLHIKTSNNEDYNCVLNKININEDKTPLGIESPLTYMESLFIQTICSYKIENYWIYELCHGKSFRQYHEEKSSDPKEPADKQEYVLGKFPKHLIFQYVNGSTHSINTYADPLLIFNELLMTAEEILDKINRRKWKMNDLPEALIEPIKGDANITEKINAKIVRTAMNLESSVKTYLKIDLDDGTYCELTSGNRTTTLFYFCDPQGLNQIHYLAETSTCEYQLFVATPLLCSHPDFSPKTSLVPISCYADRVANPKSASDEHLLELPDYPIPPVVAKPKAVLDLEREEFGHYINSQISKVSTTKVNVPSKSAPNKIINKFKEYEKVKVNPSSRKTVTSSRIGGSNIVKIEIKIENDDTNADDHNQRDSTDSKSMPPPANRGDEETYGYDDMRATNLKGDVPINKVEPRRISEKEEAFLKDIASSTGKMSQKFHVVADDVAQKFIDGDFCMDGGGLTWWKYELCLWKHLIQYHEEEDMDDEDDYEEGESTEGNFGKKEKGSTKKSRVSVTLGRWDKLAHLDWLAKNDVQSLESLKSRSQISYFYSNGDYCEDINDNRQATVILKCVKMEGNPNYISMYLSEPSTCKYLLSVNSPIICTLLGKVNALGLKMRDY